MTCRNKLKINNFDAKRFIFAFWKSIFRKVSFILLIEIPK